MPEPEATYVEVEGRTVRLTHLDKVLFPDDGITKAEILQYYVTVAPYLLPHIRGRPLTLKAFPHGINGRPYYRRKLAATAPVWLPRAPFEDGFSPYIESLPDLMWVANQDSVELHPWLSRQENLLHPDLLLFDLDPGHGVPFSRICEGAVIVRDALAQIGIQSWAKTSGGAGMHILFGVNPDYDFQQTHDWVRAVATVLAQSQPTLFTVDYSKEKRVGKLLLDYNQVGYGRTTAGVYSLRPLAGGPVSAPLTWEEVAAGNVTPDQFTIRTMGERLEALGDVAVAMATFTQRLPHL